MKKDFLAHKVFIFDFDGTLVDTVESCMVCLKKLINHLHVEYKVDQLCDNLMGPTLDEIIVRLFPNVTKEQKIELIGEFLNIYNADPISRTFLYPGIREFLELLEENEKVLFVATNKPLEPTIKLIDHYFPELFCNIMTPDAFKGKKLTKDEMIIHFMHDYDIKQDEVVMVGDSRHDMEAAHKAGVSFAFASQGYETEKMAICQQADFVIGDYAKLVAELK